SGIFRPERRFSTRRNGLEASATRGPRLWAAASAGQQVPDDFRELRPLDKERVVSLRRAELAVFGRQAGGIRGCHEAPNLIRPKQDVAVDAEAEEPRPPGSQRPQNVNHVATLARDV